MKVHPIPAPVGYKAIAYVGHFAIYAPYRGAYRHIGKPLVVLPVAAPLGIVGLYKTTHPTLAGALVAAALLTAMLGKHI